MQSAIKQLFHSSSIFSIEHLAVFYIAYSSLSCITFGTQSWFFFVSLFLIKCVIILCCDLIAGISIASGLFIPSLLSGAAFGRIIGHTLKLYGYSVDPGTYALIGISFLR